MAEGGRDGTLRTSASNGVLDQWNSGPCEEMDISDDDASTEQRMFLSQVRVDHQGPDTSLIAGVSGGVSGVNRRRNRRPMTVKGDRLETFDTWPAQMKQKPEQLAEAGFYYTAYGDKVKCFHCDVPLYNWDPEDDPFVEHARMSPGCGYILLMGKDFVRKNIHYHVMETPAVEAVLSCGTSKKSVQKALDAMIAKDGPDVVISAEKIMNTVLDIEESKNDDTVKHVDVSKEVTKLRKENKDLSEKLQCQICMDHDKEVIFFDCMHLVCCAACAESVQECPICRASISCRIKFYVS